MSGKIYFHEFAPAGMTVNNRYRARFDFEMFGQRGDDGLVGASILRRLAHFDDQHTIGTRRQPRFLSARNNLDRKSHVLILA